MQDVVSKLTSLQSQTLIRIVDDDESLRRGLEFLLSAEGFRVMSFDSALAFLRGDLPSEAGVVVLDIRMPGMLGTELFEELVRRHYRNPVIFLSAHGDIETAVRMVQLGAFNFIEKPIVPDHFLALIKQAVQQSLQGVGIVTPEEQVLAQERVASLTLRERQIVQLVLSGLSNRQLADRLGVSERTVENHRTAIYRKLSIHNLEGLKRYEQWIHPEEA